MKTLRFLIILFVLFHSTGFANGVAVVDAGKSVWLYLDSTVVSVSVIGQISKTTTTQYFRNKGTSAVVAKYGFPLSEQASAVQLRWCSDSVWTSASVAGTKQDTTLPGGGSTIPASLLTYLGATPLYFPIPDTIRAGATLAVELTYVEFLPYALGKVKYVYPSDYHLIQSGAVSHQRFDFALSSQRAIDSIKVISSHTVAMQANYKDSAKVAIDLREQTASQNYSLQYTLSLNQLGLFAYSTMLQPSMVPDSLGNGFLTFIAEPEPGTVTETIAKVFTLIIDRSGSMTGVKISQAKDAAAFIVNNLNPKDKFNIIDFDDVITSFRPGHVQLTTQSRDSALLYINALTARNMTDIGGAFSTAIPQFYATNDSTANLIIFLTDGQPTAGITNIAQLTQLIKSKVTASERDISIFCFGIGSDVNQQLLAQISSQNKGIAQFLGNDELYSSITSFYLTIRNPVLLNSRVSFTPPVVVEAFPDSLPNLYKGNQMIVAGRYSQAQSVHVTLSGTAFGRPVSYGYDVQLNDTSIDAYQFLPKIWAKRKIESLLLRYYLFSPSSAEAKALKEEIITLSQKYGVITAFTSYSSTPLPGSGNVSETREHIERALPALDFEVLGNYPNPFNPSTTISVKVNKSYEGPLEIRIYNAIGQIVCTLRLEVKGRGVYKIVWDGRDEKGAPLASGLYFYGIEWRNAVYVGKMMLIK